MAMAALLACTGDARAQANWPARAITIVSPFAAGGPADGLTRVFAAAMERNLGQPVVVTNVGGGGGMIGARQVALAQPDGYTLLMHHVGMATATSLFRDLRFDPVESFSMIGLAGEQPMVLIAGKHLPVQNIQQLIQHIRTHGDRVTMGSAGLGSGTHLCAMLLESATGLKVTTVQYRGSGPAYADIVGGRVDIMCDGTGAAVEQSKAGSVNPLLVTGTRRIDSLPNVPSATEVGLDRLGAMTIWYGLWGPANMPAPIVERLSRALQAAGRDPDVIARMRGWDTAIFETERATPAGLRDMLLRNTAMWRDILNAAGIEPQ
jgi:tripartite-type tricarboxylate transporter receptor subunit TctC